MNGDVFYRDGDYWKSSKCVGRNHDSTEYGIQVDPQVFLLRGNKSHIPHISDLMFYNTGF